MTGRVRSRGAHEVDGPILGKMLQGLEERSLDRKQERTLPGPCNKQLSHWLLAGLRAAAHRTVEGLG